jgi:diguanylate cyclase
MNLSDPISSSRTQMSPAMQASQPDVMFAPQINLTSQKIASFEAIVPWRPCEVRDQQASQSSSRWLIGEVAQAISAWRAQGYRVDVTITLFANDMIDPCFGADIATAIARHKTEPHCIVLQAPEYVLAQGGEAAFAGLEILAGMGFKIALDAAGPPTIALDKRARNLFSQLRCGGMTTLTVAKNLYSVRASSLIRRLQAANAAGLTLIARDAHSQTDLDLCAQLGFDCVQGPIVSLPAPLERCTLMLQEKGAHESVGSTVEAPTQALNQDLMTHSEAA